MRRVITNIACVLCVIGMAIAIFSGWLFGGYGLGNLLTILILGVVAYLASIVLDEYEYYEEEEEEFES